jgi:large conductance mechanosensitive channel
MAQKGMVAEFKEFLFTGDLVAIATAFIMGAALKALIDSFIKNIITGILGLFLPKDKTDFSQLKIGKSILIGNFINDIIAFVCISLVVFLLVKAYKNATGHKTAAGGPTDNALLSEIRDLLKK